MCPRACKGKKKKKREKSWRNLQKANMCSCFLLTYAQNASKAYESSVCTTEIMDIKGHTFKGISAWTAEERGQFALYAYI